MCYWILTETAKVIARSTVQSIPKEHRNTDEMRESVRIFDAKILEKLGDISKDHDYNLNVELPDYVTPEYSPFEPENVMPEADDWDSDAYDQYITAQVLIPKDGHEYLVKSYHENVTQKEILLERVIQIPYWTQDCIRSCSQMETSWNIAQM